MINLRENIWAVEVPEGAKELHIEVSLKGSPYIGYKFKDDELLNEYQNINLPPGTWEIVCTGMEATEEQAASIVDSVDSDGRGKVYMNYNNGMYVFHRSTSSLRTLLTSKGCDLNKNYLILKKL
jgi:hypothetical protein